MTITLGRIFGVSAAAVALTVLGFTAQAQMKKEDAAKKPPPPPACSKIKDAAACKARDDCVWSDEVKNDKGKVTKKAACKAKPKPKPEKKK
jgi:hypothetical protein